MQFDISPNNDEYDLLLNEEYIGKAITLEEVLSKIKKVMEAIGKK
jgi:hypothetical protein